MKQLVVLGLLLAQVLALSPVAANEKGFPGRAQYPAVKTIDTAELYNKLADVMIVDTRSSLEYQTLRIRNALNIPVASTTFVEQVRALRATSAQPIVFYCNGRSCFKSYRAVELAQKGGVNNTLAYDAGMFDWVEQYPANAELLSQSPVNKSAIISSAEFKQRLLEPVEFSEKVYGMGKQSLVIDVRDKFQRGAAGFFPGKETWVSLDDRQKLQRYIDKAKEHNKTLFIYDEVGKQVRWLQYTLKQAQVEDYYFMNKGAKGYYAAMMKDFGFTTERLR